MASKEERTRKKIKVVASTVFAAIFIASIVVIGLIFSEKQEKTVEKEWWKTSTIYHIYVPSFKDSNGDGYGDLNGKMIFFVLMSILFDDSLSKNQFFLLSYVSWLLRYLYNIYTLSLR